MFCCEQKMGEKEMKITKYPNHITMTPHQVCPCCGETREFRIINDKLVGVDFIGTQKEYKGFIRTKIVCTDRFACYTCGAEWEGDPYEK